jgi:hypothetical protein
MKPSPASSRNTIFVACMRTLLSTDFCKIIKVPNQPDQHKLKVTQSDQAQPITLSVPIQPVGLFEYASLCWPGKIPDFQGCTQVLLPHDLLRNLTINSSKVHESRVIQDLLPRVQS